MKLTKQIMKVHWSAVLIVAGFSFSHLAESEGLKLEPQFKYLITAGPGAGQYIVGNPPHLVFTGVIKYYDTPEDAFLEYPDFIERSVLAGGEITFARVRNFRVVPNSGIVNGKYDSYCWDLYREIDGVSVEPLTCTGGVWMKPFCPAHYHLEHTYYRESKRFIHHYDCEPGEKSESPKQSKPVKP